MHSQKLSRGQEMKNRLAKEPRLIEIKEAKKVIFVGDTHGDLEASKIVIDNYLKPGCKIVFLGDYVDRGPFSRENLEFLLQIKAKNPNQIYLLQGNHEGYHILKFSPADFWESLVKNEYGRYCSVVEELPLTVVTNNIIALHGALPHVKNLTEIDQIKLGSEQWQQVTWGDFVENPGGYLGIDPFTGRPQFGKDWFFELMKRFNKMVLVRAHQPNAPQFMFDDKCLTIFTSYAYARERTVAIADLTKKIRDAKDLEIEKI